MYFYLGLNVLILYTSKSVYCNWCLTLLVSCHKIIRFLFLPYTLHILSFFAERPVLGNAVY